MFGILFSEKCGTGPVKKKDIRCLTQRQKFGDNGLLITSQFVLDIVHYPRYPVFNV
jgi:hypothetical protein